MLRALIMRFKTRRKARDECLLSCVIEWGKKPTPRATTFTLFEPATHDQNHPSNTQTNSSKLPANQRPLVEPEIYIYPRQQHDPVQKALTTENKTHVRMTLNQ